MLGRLEQGLKFRAADYLLTTVHNKKTDKGVTPQQPHDRENILAHNAEWKSMGAEILTTKPAASSQSDYTQQIKELQFLL